MEDEDMTEIEIDALFRATKPIGDALHAVAEAELIVEVAATKIPAAVRDRLNATLRAINQDLR